MPLSAVVGHCATATASATASFMGQDHLTITFESSRYPCDPISPISGRSLAAILPFP
jgi:hypothetical protein